MLPAVCPSCGARDSFRARYATGGGWRVTYRCRECGHAASPVGRAAAAARARPLTTAVLVAAVLGWLGVRSNSESTPERAKRGRKVGEK